MADPILLPDGFLAGHHTDAHGWTGCTAIIAPAGSVASGEVRGGGPGTRESDLLSPATSTPGPEAVVLTGGSAFGLAAADGVARWLIEEGRGYETPAGRVPLVAGAVVYDLMLGDAGARPGPEQGYAACAAAAAEVARGSVGAGTGCTVGKVLGPGAWTKGGLGAARVGVEAASLVAVAAVNPVGDVLGADGRVLAGAWRDGRWAPTVALLAAGERPKLPERQSTTLVCLATDAQLSKLDAWRVARAAAAGVARSVSPCATAFDGDMTFCLASGTAGAVDPLALSALAAEAASQAIRDAVLQATGAPGCPSAADRLRAGR